MENKLLFEGILGSRAYGYPVNESDLDIRGVYLLPTKEFLKLADYPKNAIMGEGDSVHWELKHFIEQLVKGGTSAVELLFLDNYTVKPSEYLSPLFQMRNDFLTKNLLRKYIGYFYSIRNKYTQNPSAKHAASLFRLSRVAYDLGVDHKLTVQLSNDYRRIAQQIRTSESPIYLKGMVNGAENTIEFVEHNLDECDLPLDCSLFLQKLDNLLVNIRIRQLHGEI